MHARPTSEFLIYGTFWALALALVGRILAAGYFRYSRNPATLRRRAIRRERAPRWLASGTAGLLLVAGWVLLAILTANAVGRWRLRVVSPRNRKELPLDLHIPQVVPTRTYTVIAKFRVGGRQYVSAPLPVRFGAQKPVYHLLLQYDSRHPERNAWSGVPADRRAIERAAGYAIGWMILTILLLEWLELVRLNRKSRSGDTGVA